MKKLIFILFTFTTLLCSSQKIEALDITNEIKIEAAKFLVYKQEIENIDNFESKMSILEILDKKVLGFNEIGIYKLFPHKSPSFTYIILKNKNKYSFIDLKDFSLALEKITKFLNTSKFDNDKIVNYLEKIIETYKDNDYNNKIRM